MSKDGNRLLLTVICLADSRPLRPRIGCCTLIRKLWHHLKLCDRLGSLTNRRSHTIISGISTANNNDILTFGIYPALFLAGEYMLCRTCQEIHSEVDSIGFSSLCLDITWIGSTACKDHTVIFLQQICCLHIFSHISIDNKLYTFFFHDLLLPVNHPFFQLHIRDTIHQKTTDMIISLIYRNGMTTTVQLVCCCQSGRAGADHGNLFAGACLWRLRSHQIIGIAILDNGVFVCLAGDRCVIQTTGAGCFTKCRTHSGSKLREVIRLFQTVVGFFPVSIVD